MLMMLCHQKVTKQGKKLMFLTLIIENGAFAKYACYEIFYQQKLVPQGYSFNFNSSMS